MILKLGFKSYFLQGKLKKFSNQCLRKALNCIYEWVHCIMVMFRALQGMSQGSAGGVKKYHVTPSIADLWYQWSTDHRFHCLPLLLLQQIPNWNLWWAWPLAIFSLSSRFQRESSIYSNFWSRIRFLDFHIPSEILYRELHNGERLIKLRELMWLGKWLQTSILFLILFRVENTFSSEWQHLPYFYWDSFLRIMCHLTLWIELLSLYYLSLSLFSL